MLLYGHLRKLIQAVTGRPSPISPFVEGQPTAPQPHSPHCQKAHPPTEADRGPDSTVSPRPRATEQENTSSKRCVLLN